MLCSTWVLCWGLYWQAQSYYCFARLALDDWSRHPQGKDGYRHWLKLTLPETVAITMEDGIQEIMLKIHGVCGRQKRTTPSCVSQCSVYMRITTLMRAIIPKSNIELFVKITTWEVSNSQCFQNLWRHFKYCCEGNHGTISWEVQGCYIWLVIKCSLNFSMCLLHSQISFLEGQTL